MLKPIAILLEWERQLQILTSFRHLPNTPIVETITAFAPKQSRLRDRTPNRTLEPRSN